MTDAFCMGYCRYTWVNEGGYCLSQYKLEWANKARYINSCGPQRKPNITVYWESNWRVGYVVALRRIRPGEQLLASYKF